MFESGLGASLLRVSLCTGMLLAHGGVYAGEVLLDCVITSAVVRPDHPARRLMGEDAFVGDTVNVRFDDESRRVIADDAINLSLVHGERSTAMGETVVAVYITPTKVEASEKTYLYRNHSRGMLAHAIQFDIDRVSGEFIYSSGSPTNTRHNETKRGTCKPSAVQTPLF